MALDMFSRKAHRTGTSSCQSAQVPRVPSIAHQANVETIEDISTMAWLYHCSVLMIIYIGRDYWCAPCNLPLPVLKPLMIKPSFSMMFETAVFWSLDILWWTDSICISAVSSSQVPPEHSTAQPRLHTAARSANRRSIAKAHERDRFSWEISILAFASHVSHRECNDDRAAFTKNQTSISTPPSDWDPFSAELNTVYLWSVLKSSEFICAVPTARLYPTNSYTILNVTLRLPLVGGPWLMLLVTRCHSDISIHICVPCVVAHVGSYMIMCCWIIHHEVGPPNKKTGRLNHIRWGVQWNQAGKLQSKCRNRGSSDVCECLQYAFGELILKKCCALVKCQLCHLRRLGLSRWLNCLRGDGSAFAVANLGFQFLPCVFTYFCFGCWKGASSHSNKPTPAASWR